MQVWLCELCGKRISPNEEYVIDGVAFVDLLAFGKRPERRLHVNCAVEDFTSKSSWLRFAKIATLLGALLGATFFVDLRLIKPPPQPLTAREKGIGIGAALGPARTAEIIGAAGGAPGSGASQINQQQRVEQPHRQIEEGHLKSFFKKVKNMLLDFNAMLNAIAGALTGTIFGGAVGFSAVLFRRAFRVRRRTLRPRPS